MTRVRHLNTEFDTGLVWFRRDLRSTDQAALYYALKHCRRVWCVFVFDTTILQPIIETWRSRRPDHLPEDRRVEFIRAALEELDQALRQNGGGLIVA
jgi:deoxyribodipyrimidine photo-lyase